MRIALVVTSIFAIIITLLPFIKAPVGLIRIWEFPRLQIVVLIAICAIGWIYFKPSDNFDIVLIIGLVLSAAYHLYTIMPYTTVWKREISATEKPVPEQSFSILFYNVYMPNRKVEAYLELAKEVSPDLLLLVETDQYWADALKPLHAEYPNRVEVPLDNTYGMILYSRLPLRNTSVEYLLKDDIPSIHTDVQLKSGKYVRLYCVHPEPPGLAKSTTDRDAELLQVAKIIEKKDEPSIVAGDLNDVAWSESTHLFGKISQCNDPRVGRGLLNSFNSKIPLMRWPLDHFFLSDDFTVDAIKRQKHIGSDHFPMFLKATMSPSGNDGTGADQPDQGDREEAEEKIEAGREENGQ